MRSRPIHPDRLAARPTNRATVDGAAADDAHAHVTTRKDGITFAIQAHHTQVESLGISLLARHICTS
jgi:hypothetical protein